MDQFWGAEQGSRHDHDGPLLYVIRLVAGSAMVLFICLGFTAIRRRDIARHRAWMMRGYAIGLGAGTPALTHVPYFLFEGLQGELSRALAMGAGWAINLAVAEWIIRRRLAGGADGSRQLEHNAARHWRRCPRGPGLRPVGSSRAQELQQ